jgi:NADPH:quinone reductase-like Zn-dependent oxidoreductase
MITNVRIGTEEYRQWGPLIPRERWNSLLSSCGFNGIDLVFPIVDTCSGNVMISRAKELAKNKSALKSLVELSKFIVLTIDDSPVQAEIASKLINCLKAATNQDFGIVTFEKARIHSEVLTESFCISLLEVRHSILWHISEEDYPTLKQICLRPNTIIWVSSSSAAENPTSSMIDGLMRTLRYEHPQQKSVALALHDLQNFSTAVSSICNVANRTMLVPIETYEPEYREIDGVLHINRILPDQNLDNFLSAKTNGQAPIMTRFDQDPSRSLKLRLGTPGVLSSLQFVDDPNPSLPLCPDELEIHVRACGLNFKDILSTLGQEAAIDLGCEASGVVSRVGQNAAPYFQIGDRVACCCDGTMSTYARPSTYLAVSKIPDSMSFTTAAAFPVTYLTAYQAIINVAQLQTGETILIHSAAGGFGQACVQLANLRGAEIFATVSTEEKRQLLMNTYGVREDHIFSSRTPAFADGIKRLTKGRGLDVIINSLANEALRVTWECIGHYGRFVEVGKRDIYNLGTLPMFPFSRSVSFTSVDLWSAFAFKPTLLRELFQGVMSLFAKDQVSVPSPLQVYDGSQIENAFRHLQSGTSMGKIVIEIKGSDLVPV